MEMIDVDLAATTARATARPGVRLSPRQARAEVAGLHAAATASVETVQQLTGLDVARGLDDSQVLVLDRPGWARSTVTGLVEMTRPGFEAVQARNPLYTSRIFAGASRATASVQLGTVLGYLSTRILGQYDPFVPGPAGGGRLVLVAPNTAMIRGELDLDPVDFRLWVCLHEQTHRVQFAAAPWLAEYLQQAVTSLLVMMTDPDQALNGRDAIKAQMSTVNGVMSLLEGHANVVMDAVSTSLVPTKHTIRRRFNDRKPPGGPLGALFRKLIGMDAKAAQYRNGQQFVQAVVAQIGMDGFNRVFTDARYMPTEAELHDAAAWIARTEAL